MNGGDKTHTHRHLTQQESGANMAELVTGILLGVFLILGLLFKYLRSPNRYWEKLNIPCVDRSSWWDSMRDCVSGKTHDIYLEGLKKYGRIYGSFDFGKPTLIVTDPTIVKNVLVKDFNIFHNTSDTSDIIPSHDIFGKMLFVLRDERWKRVRTIISPVFTTGKIKKTVTHINDSTKTLLRNFADSVKKGDDKIDVKDYYEAYAMDLIANVAFATKIDSHNDPQNAFVVNARKILDSSLNWRLILVILLPRLAKFAGVSTINPEAKKFFTNVVTAIVKERQKSNEKYNDLIQLLMDASADDAGEMQSGNDASIGSKKLTKDELLANSIMFFFVAFGTTSMTLSLISYALATNPECQEKLIQEIDEVLKENDFQFTYEAVQNMKYLDMVVSETLRLYPTAIRTEREAEADYVLETTGTKVKKGTLITIPIYAMQRDPEIYPEPEKFDPNRFSPEEKAKRDTYAYIPFSAGPRNCVGMRFALLDIKMALAYVLSQFRFKRCPETPVPLVIDVGTLAPILQLGKIVLRIEKRTDNVLERFY